MCCMYKNTTFSFFSQVFYYICLKDCEFFHSLTVWVWRKKSKRNFSCRFSPPEKKVPELGLRFPKTLSKHTEATCSFLPKKEKQPLPYSLGRNNFISQNIQNSLELF